MSDVNEKISVKEKIGYGLGDAASNIIFQTVMTFLAFFYTDVFGISAAAVGTLFLSVRVLDAVTDPVMGNLADRTSTRWGSYRPYILWLAIPFGLISFLTFSTPEFSDTGKLIYAYVTYALLMMIYTAINIPYCALGGVLTSNPKERVSIQSYRFAFASLAGVLITSTTLPLVDFFGEGDLTKGYQTTMAIMSILGVLLFWGCFISTKERLTVPTKKPTSVKTDFKALLKNDQWILVAVITFVVMFAVILRATVSLYYVNYVLESSELATLFVTLGMIGMFLGSVLAPIATRYFCKIKVYAVSTALISSLCLTLFFIEPTYVYFIFALHFIIGLLQQMTTPIIWVMMTDTVDYGELKTGKRMTAFTFSGSLFILKLGMSIAGAVAGWILAFYGYQGSAEQSAESLFGINLLFTLIPGFASLLAFALVTKYRLNSKEMSKITESLKHKSVNMELEEK